MTVHREANVHHKHIIMARKTLIFTYFSAKLCQKLFEIYNLICLVLDGISFYEKCFFGWKVKFYIWRIKFLQDEKKKTKKTKTTTKKKQ